MSNYNYSTTRQYSNSSNCLQTALNLSSKNLKFPYFLTISTTSKQLNGQVILDGKLIKQIINNKETINLSPYFSLGQNSIELIANYFPPSASVKVKFSGVGTSSTQETSGSGKVKYTLLITVY